MQYSSTACTLQAACKHFYLYSRLSQVETTLNTDMNFKVVVSNTHKRPLQLTSLSDITDQRERSRDFVAGSLVGANNQLIDL